GLLARLFGDAPARVASLVKRFHNRGPVVVTVKKPDAETLGHAVFLDVQFENAFAQNANPILRRAELDHVADVEMPADLRAVDLLQIRQRLFRFGDEIVPDVFDGNFDAHFFSQWDRFADFGNRSLPTILVRHFLVHHLRLLRDAGHQQHGRGAVPFGVTQRLLQTGQAFFPHAGIGGGKRLAPMRVAANAGGFEAGLVECLYHLVLVHVAHRLYTFEARVLDR